MKTDVIIALVVGGIGLIALTVMIMMSWEKWRKKALTDEGKTLGFRRLAQGESLPVVLVPLIDRADRKYAVILRGEINGHEAAFFDLYCSSGENWFYQSTVMSNHPGVTMPKFQLKSPDWSKVIRQRTCGDEIRIPGREKDMASLRLSAADPQWALQTFAKAAPQFFKKLQKGNWTIEGYQHSLVVYSWGKTIAPGKLRDYVTEAAGIASETYLLL